MEDIIRQIDQIDKIAGNIKKSNEEALIYKQMQYEEEMENYKVKVLENARQKAEEIYRISEQENVKEYTQKTEQTRLEAQGIETYYGIIKEKMLDEIFGEFISMEE